jgi:hypothetical protein
MLGAFFLHLGRNAWHILRLSFVLSSVCSFSPASALLILTFFTPLGMLLPSFWSQCLAHGTFPSVHTKPRLTDPRFPSHALCFSCISLTLPKFWNRGGKCGVPASVPWYARTFKTRPRLTNPQPLHFLNGGRKAIEVSGSR